MPDCIAERAEALKSSIYLVSEEHSRRLGKAATNASNASWLHTNAMRKVYHSRSVSELKEALENLSNLNKSY